MVLGQVLYFLINSCNESSLCAMLELVLKFQTQGESYDTKNITDLYRNECKRINGANAS
jgi:hypothetical protein